MNMAWVFSMFPMWTFARANLLIPCLENGNAVDCPVPGFPWMSFLLYSSGLMGEHSPLAAPVMKAVPLRSDVIVSRTQGVQRQ